MSFLEQPEDLLQYFADQAEFLEAHPKSEFAPGDDRWSKAVRTTQLWIDLIAHPDRISPENLTELFAAIAIHHRHGSGWYDLKLRLCHWIETLPLQTQITAATIYAQAMIEHDRDTQDWEKLAENLQEWHTLIEQSPAAWWKTERLEEMLHISRLRGLTAFWFFKLIWTASPAHNPLAPAVNNDGFSRWLNMQIDLRDNPQVE